MQPRRLLPFLFLSLFVAALFSGGCTTVERGGGIELQMSGFSVGEISLTGASGEVTIDVRNTSVIPYVIKKSVHRVFIDGKLVGEAVSNESWGVQAQGSTKYKAKLHLANAAAFDAVRAVLATGKLSYRLETRLTSSVFDEEQIVKIDTAGVLDLNAAK